MIDTPQPNLPPEGAYSDLERLFIEEQPKGLWPTNQNSNFGAFRKVITDQLQRAVQIVHELEIEQFVGSSFGYLTRWEREVGLPIAPMSKTVPERRLLVLGRLRKTLFTREGRRRIVENHVVEASGGSVPLVPEGVELTGDGIALNNDEPVEIPVDAYTIVEDVEDFSYHVYIKDTIIPDLVSLTRELEWFTPAHISFEISLVPDPLVFA